MRVTASDPLSSAAHVLPLACRQRRTMPHTVGRVHAMAMVFVLFLVAMCSGVSVAAPHSSHGISEASLWALSSMTNGAHWTVPWVQGTPMCSLPGVTCLPGGGIQVHLVGNNITGTIPPQLFCAPDLLYLDLRANVLSGSILPPTRGLCASLLGAPSDSDVAVPMSLEFLDVSCNKFAGPFPGQLLDPMNAPNLTSLFLSENSFSGALPPIPPRLVRTTL